MKSRTEKQGERIARRIARAGLCSRREAEQWILAGRVEVNGKKIASPALDVTAEDQIRVDGTPLPSRERTPITLLLAVRPWEPEVLKKGKAVTAPEEEGEEKKEK